MKRQIQHNRNGGFTLVELLAVVAVLIILLGVSAVSAAYYMDYLKITELDNAAREIYMAAENRAALLANGSRLEKLVARGGNSVSGVGDAGGNAEGCVIANGDETLKELLPAGTIESKLWEGDFYIVYEPKSGCVTDVFYAESEIAPGEFQSFYNVWRTASRRARMDHDPMLGYYGGGQADADRFDRLHTPGVTVLIRNEEKLTVQVDFQIPENGRDAEITKDVTLTYGGQFINLLDSQYAGRLLAYKEGANNSSFSYTWELDSLETDRQFADLFPNIEPGGDFTVTATVEVSMEGGKPSQAQAEDTNNSLFDKDSTVDTAKIRYLRHLQNLDTEFSQVSGSITKAEQVSNIPCYDNETYQDYKFTPIQNNALNSYNGNQKELQSLCIDFSGDAGLFSETQDMKFEGVRLLNARVHGDGSTGGLVGVAKGETSFEDCWVYWEPTEEKNLQALLLQANGKDYDYKISGPTAGGLAGTLEGRTTVKDCLSATLVYGSGTAGGLVGEAENTLDVTGSYADCYLAGKNLAGLVGSVRTLRLENCYAAGFIDMTQAGSAAGLCLGTNAAISAQHVYSAMRHTNRPEGTTFYHLAEAEQKGVFSGSTYYLNIGAGPEIPGAVSCNYDRMSAMGDKEGEVNFAQTVGGEFAWKELKDSHPYNLRENLKLTIYSFPGLRRLPHYGDWSAQFKEPSLVYYEKYDGDKYGFSGGNARHLFGSLSDETVRLDGYAVALLQSDLATSTSVDITYTYFDANGARQTYTETIAKQDWLEAKWTNEGDEEPTNYYLIPLPNALVADNKIASPDFYQYLRFSLEGSDGMLAEGEYLYNPHFAETVRPLQTKEAPEGGWTAQSVAERAAEQIRSEHYEVDIRTPRHLNDLSEYQNYYSNEKHRYVFRQKLNLDYKKYDSYSDHSNFSQKPIGTGKNPFRGTYDGMYHHIRNVVFTIPEGETETCAGLFGSSAGTLQDIVYHLELEKPLVVSRGQGQSLYVGGLAGRNANGTIRNCAVEGLRLDARSYYAWLYVGGLVGQNSGVIRDGMAESPSLEVDVNSFGSAYVGGLVSVNGSNSWVETSYAVGRFSGSVDRNSNALVCGFVSRNEGHIVNSYSATQLEASGTGAVISGFCGRTSGAGTQSGTYYLNMGNFTYRDVPFAASYPDETVGLKEASYKELSAENSLISRMERLTGKDAYPYPTAVRDEAGRPVYHGKYWPVPLDLGQMGVYYWEKLTVNGAENYYIKMLAVNPKTQKMTQMSTLSNAHDDGGVVTEYGYGYYTHNEHSIIDVSSTDIHYVLNGQNFAFSNKTPNLEDNKSDAEKQADRKLQELMPEFMFHSYLSYTLGKDGGGLYPQADSNKPNGTVTLKQDGKDGKELAVEFTWNPFFAGALSVELPNGWTGAGVPVTRENSPGHESNAYGVRSIRQLQFINWNSGSKNTRTVMSGSDTQLNFPYLSNSASTGKYYWVQSHDIQGELEEDGTYRKYTPIAEYYDSSDKSLGNLSGWFGGHYDGANYVIENVNIQGQMASCAGLFGVVYNGTLKNIVMYSSTGESTVTSGYYTNTQSSWYAIGALAGVAASHTGNAVENCAVSGYTIKAYTYTATNSGRWGGTGVGGLLGISNMNLSGCSSVVDVQVLSGSTSNDNMRIGGLVGVCQKGITACYAGGSIKIESGVDTKGNGIYVGGIVGGCYMKPLWVAGQYNTEGRRVTIGYEYDTEKATGNDNKASYGAIDNSLTDCYSYVELPDLKSINGDKTGYRDKQLRALYALGGTGEINSSVTVDKQYEYSHLPNGSGARNHGTCTITNCYYLRDSVLAQNTEVNLTTDGIKTDLLQEKGPGNDSPLMGLSYEQLEGTEDIQKQKETKKIYDWLNQTSTRYYPVTSKIGDYAVPGKYSYPPESAAELRGLDYPFPTILTRMDGTEQRHVHYGQWPTNGIIRKEHGGAPIELDLFAQPKHEETFTLTSNVAKNGTWSYEILDPDIAEVKLDETSGKLTVTGKLEGTTTLTVSYQAPNRAEPYKRLITVHVTAELHLFPPVLAMTTKDTVLVKPEPRDRDGNDLSGSGTLKLTDVSGSASVTAERVKAPDAPVDEPTFTEIRLTSGETATDVPEMVNISYTYTVGDKEYTGTSAIRVTVVQQPELKKGEGGYTLTFPPEKFQAVQVNQPYPEGVEVKVEENVITLTPEAPLEEEREITLDVMLTIDGQQYSLDVTVTLPPEEEEPEAPPKEPEGPEEP